MPVTGGALTSSSTIPPPSSINRRAVSTLSASGDIIRVCAVEDSIMVGVCVVGGDGSRRRLLDPESKGLGLGFGV
jgi:hypothetical protein